MAKLKILDGFRSEIYELNTSGDALAQENKKIKTEAFSTLKTCVKYAEQHNDIRNLLKKYRDFLDKESKDLYRLADEFRDMDKILASKIKSQI